jgi:hypothetical protein
MTLLPDWDSIESTARWSDGLFWAGIVFLVLLAAAEVASHIISKRSAFLDAGSLTESQIGHLVSSLRLVPKSEKPVYVMGLQGNDQSISLAKALSGALMSAGFPVNGPWEDNLIGGTGSGILIRQKIEAGPIGVGIRASLSAVGLSTRMIVRSDYADDQVDVIVGHRPFRDE